MRDARAANKEDDLADMLCLLVYYFNINQEEVLDMPHLRSEILVEWFADIMEKTKGTGSKDFMEGGF